MNRQGLSDTRGRILEFIRGFVDERGYTPTVREILKGLQISSTSVVQYHLNVLEREGHITRDREVFRSIQLSGRKKTISVPLLGYIAAGEPLPIMGSDSWVSESLDTLDLPEDMVKGKEVYALRVKGYSMVDALIDDGDIVLVQPAATAENGEVVAVRLKNEQGVTLKKLYREPGRIRLQPANPALSPIYTTADNVDVQGKIIGVLRKL